MEIIAEYDDAYENIIGVYFYGPLPDEMEIAEEVLDDSKFVSIVRDNVLIFHTLEGDVEYVIVNYDLSSALYTAEFVEDRRNEV